MEYTLKKIAEEMNVSVSTVSRVVNNKVCVDEDTRVRIMAHIKKRNYVQNQIARSLKNSYTKTVGILIPDISEDYFANIVKGIDSVLNDQKYTILLADSCEDSEKEKDYLNLMIQNRVDALVLATVSKNQSHLQTYFDKNIPVVFIDNLPSKAINADSVLLDNQLASMYAVNHLISNGHNTIAIITGKLNETTGFQRLAGYKKALRQNNITISEKLIKYGDFKETSGYQCMKELIDNRNNKPFSAVYVCSEKMTYGAIKCIMDCNLRISDDIALVGFDIHDKSGLVSPSITTIMQPEKEIGKLVGELVLKRLNEKNTKNKRSIFTIKKQNLIIQPELKIKESSIRE